jgi:hypothetical protein
MPFTLRLPVLLDQAITKAAKEKGLHKSVLVEQILREWVKDERDRKSGWDQGEHESPERSRSRRDAAEEIRRELAGHLDPAS